MEHSDAGFGGVGYISDDLHLRTGFRQVCLSAYIVERAEGQAFISHTVVESGKGIVDIKLRKLFVFLSKDQFP